MDLRQKSVVVPETIDAVRQLILQDRHVIYREIETTLGISGTSIHLIVKKNCSHWIPHNLSFAQKKPHVDWSNEMHQKYDRGASKHVIVTGDESWIYAYKHMMKQIQHKLLAHKALRSN